MFAVSLPISFLFFFFSIFSFLILSNQILHLFCRQEPDKPKKTQEEEEAEGDMKQMKEWLTQEEDIQKSLGLWEAPAET